MAGSVEAEEEERMEEEEEEEEDPEASGSASEAAHERPSAEAAPQYLPRLRSRSLMPARLSLFFKPQSKSRAPASHIARMFEPSRRTPLDNSAPTLNSNGDADSLPPVQPQAEAGASQSMGVSLRRSTRKRRTSVYMGLDSDSDAEDTRIRVSRRHDFRAMTLSARRRRQQQKKKKKKKVSRECSPPRRAGLRPRRARASRPDFAEDYECDEEFDDHDQDSSDADGDDAEEDKGEDQEGLVQRVGEVREEEEKEEKKEKVIERVKHDKERKRKRERKREECREQDEDEEDDEEEGDEEEEEEEEEREGRRRYALRSRTEVQRFSPRKEEQPTRGQSPHKLYHSGNGAKRGREGLRCSSRGHKRYREDDSDDSLLVDDMDQGTGGSWTLGHRDAGNPFIPPGNAGGDINAASASWSLSNTGTGWGNANSSDHWAPIASGTGVQAAGPTSKAGADIQPIVVDDSVGFDQIGGLSSYIDSLKEMVFFPLMYPKFFANYHITPPRGVLLCGPPGTGKTLVARALAAAASRAGKRVSFFMRKGADVLSKWVGEAERQLKILFEEAQRCQPSIIFFDEIDGLAPVRSSKQEQIHNSIVSTLLALMDGLNSRGQVVVIGATNRVDAIDSALRRPGRFDREFVFPLPDSKAREAILDIHTRKWQSPPTEGLKAELAASCVGYCGADLKALCTEAAIRAFRKKYPQIYQSDEQYVLDVDSVEVEKHHFIEAMSSITPASHRGALIHARPLPATVAPCLKGQIDAIIDRIREIFPPERRDDALSSDDEEEDINQEDAVKLFGFGGTSFSLVYRPRFLICGMEGAGLDYIGPAVLHELERYPVHSLGLPSLLADSGARSPEEALVHVFQEARRSTPSVLYLPQLQLWWETAHDQLRAVLQMLLSEFPPNLPVLLLGTSSVPAEEVDQEALKIFGQHVHEVRLPSAEDRRSFFSQMVETAVEFFELKSRKKKKQKALLPVLRKAPAAEKGPSEAEILARTELEEHAIRRLRMCLRDVCNRLLYEKRFSVFHYPVTEREAPDYRSIVETPMDVATLLQRVDSGHYLSRAAFLEDVELIPTNAKAYNGDDYTTSRIYSKACSLRDAVHGMLSQIDPALLAQCDSIAAHRGPTKEGVAASSAVANPPENTAPLGEMQANARSPSVQPESHSSTFVEPAEQPKKSLEGEIVVEGSFVPEAAANSELGEKVDAANSAEGPDVNMNKAGNLGLHSTHDSCGAPTSSSCPPSSENAARIAPGVPETHMMQECENGPPGTSDMETCKEKTDELIQRLVLGTEGFKLSQLESVNASFRNAQNQSKKFTSLASLNFLEALISGISHTF